MHLLHRLELSGLGEVDLVDGHDRFDVDPVACEDIQHLLDIDVLTDDDGRIDVSVRGGHVLDGLHGDLGELQGGLDLDTAVVGVGDDHIGLLLVQTDGRVVQLPEQDVHVGVEDVHHEQDDIGGPCGGDDLPSPSDLETPNKTAQK